MDIALISDTHVPSRASAIPEWVRDRVTACDHVIHAGDFDSPDAYETVRALAGGDDALTAVAGNMDPHALELPDVAVVTFEGITFCVTHGDGGPRRTYRERVAATVRENVDGAAVGVAGHTHEYLDAREGGVRLLNPGSATGARPARETSMLVATVADGDLSVSAFRR